MNDTTTGGKYLHKNPPPHHCDRPGDRLIVGDADPVKGDLWVCKTCGTYWRWKPYSWKRIRPWHLVWIRRARKADH